MITSNNILRDPIMIILIWLFNHSFKSQFVTKIYHKEDKSHSLYINWGILWKHLVIIIKHFFCHLATICIDSNRQVEQHVKYVKVKYSNISCLFDFPGFLMIEVWNYHNKVYNQTRKCKVTKWILRILNIFFISPIKSHLKNHNNAKMIKRNAHIPWAMKLISPPKIRNDNDFNWSMKII